MQENKEAFFELLKQKRVSQNIEISDICEFTKINPRYIEAIESGDFTVLPTVYMRLFLKAYASFINSDPKTVLEDYELFTTGAILDNSNLNAESDINPNYSEVSLGQDSRNISQITPQKIATILIASLGIFLALFWASKITSEQNVELNEAQISSKIQSLPMASLDPLNKINLQENALTKRPEISSGNINQKGTKVKEAQKKSISKINNQEKKTLDANNYLADNRLDKSTNIIKIDKPYRLSISTLQKTRLNISKSNEDSSKVLINDIINANQELNYEFESTINFDFLNNSHIRVTLNNISLDEYLFNNGTAIRGSYIAENSQLYIAFYKPN